MRSGRAPGLGPFLDELEVRLRAMGTEDLVSALLGHAQTLPVGARFGFLSLFTASPGPRVSKGTNGQWAGSPHDHPLVPEIDGFVEAVRSGTYFQGWGWDPDRHEERAWGDESWVEEMDELFEEAGAAFVAGDLEVAAVAYGRLLHTFDLDQEVGTFCGPEPAPDMVKTDLGEAKARYLRALYETTPLPDRAGRLLAEAEELVFVGGETSLRRLSEARRGGLPDLDSFLPGWIASLEEAPRAGWGFGAEARRLLAEAVEWQSGVDGLAALARRPGSGQAEAYRDWVDALAQSGKRAEAREAATEALAVLEPCGEVRATIAERLARLASPDEPSAALEARRAAWRASPSRSRLLRVIEEAKPLGLVDETIAAEAELVRPSNRRRRPAETLADDARLASEALLLAGRVGEAVTLLDRAGALGWSARQHPGPVVLPYLLVAASGAHTHPAWANTLLFEQVEGIDNLVWWPPSEWDMDADAWYQDPVDDSAYLPGEVPPEPLLLSTLLVDSLDGRPVPAPTRTRWLSVAQRVIAERVKAIVGGQHRGAYEGVARLVVAEAEALELARESGTGGGLLSEVRASYPRHTAFRSELDRAQEASPLLPPPPSRQRR